MGKKTFKKILILKCKNRYLKNTTGGPFPPIFLEDEMVAMPMFRAGAEVESGSGPRVRQIFPETWLFSNEVAEYVFMNQRITNVYKI